MGKSPRLEKPDPKRALEPGVVRGHPGNFATGYTIGAFIHVLLVVAIVLLLVGLLSGRRVA